MKNFMFGVAVTVVGGIILWFVLPKASGGNFNLQSGSSLVTQSHTGVGDNIAGDKVVSYDSFKYSLFSAEQIEALSLKLKRHTGIEVTLHRENSPDLIPFVNQLKEIFNKADWRIKKSNTYLTAGFDGIRIWGKGIPNEYATEYVSELYLGMKALGVEHLNVSADSDLDPKAVVIQIGKPK